MTKSPSKKIGIEKQAKETEEIIKTRTPTKQKSSHPIIPTSSGTPPKQRRTDENSSPGTPSVLLNKLDLNNSEKSKFEPKNLFNNKFQDARKALHGSVPKQMPCRELELAQLREFINNCIHNKRSESLYVSGAPGTGKTAAISIILEELQITEYAVIFINCTTIKSSRAIYSRIIHELKLKTKGYSEKECLSSIENYLKQANKSILLILDEIDQLTSKNQSILYTIFEWPTKASSNLILIGIANALDLTDRILPHLQAHCELRPKLLHFAPYTKQQIIEIFMQRLQNTNASNVFSPAAIQILAGKVASVSGDVRRALDIGRRVVELTEKQCNKLTLQSIENIVDSDKVELTQVVNVLNNVYGTSQNLTEDCNSTIPLQQRIIICSLLLIIKKARNKDVTVGKLHDVYKKVCEKRNVSAVDQAEFVGLCSLIETRGIIRVIGKKDPRLHKIMLQWNDEEVIVALQDKQLMSSILQDDKCLGRL